MHEIEYATRQILPEKYANILLDEYKYNLLGLKRTSTKELQMFPGIGKYYANVLTLMYYYIDVKINNIPQIRSSMDAYYTIKNSLPDISYEVENFIVAYLNRKNSLLLCKVLTTGNNNRTIVDNLQLTKQAILHNASAVIIAHNHISGSMEPSENDISITRKAITAFDIFDIKVLDHIIFDESQHYSFADNDLI